MPNSSLGLCICKSLGKAITSGNFVKLGVISEQFILSARSLIAQLRQEQIEKIKIVGEAEVESSAYGQVVLGAGAVAGLDEQLALEAAKAGPSI